MKKITLLLFLVTISWSSLLGQDHIQQLINQEKYDTLLQVVTKKVDEGNFEEVVNIGNRILKKAPSNNQHNARFLSLIGSAEWYLGNVEKADSLLKESLIFAKVVSDTFTIVKSNISLGYIYMNLGNYADALNYLYQAEKYAQNNCVELVRIKDDISYIYILQGGEREIEAESLLLETQKIAQECNDTLSLVNINNSIGFSYIGLKKNDLALQHYLRAKELAEKINYIKGKAIALSNLTDFYLKQNNNQKALHYCKESLELEKEIKNIEGQAFSYAQLAQIYLDEKQYSEAISNISKANELANKLSIPNLRVKFLKIKFDAEVANNDLKSGLESLKEFYALKDSLIGIEKSKDLNEVKEKYETDKLKQAKIIAEKEQKTAKKLAIKNRNLFIFSVIMGVLGLCVALFFMYQIRLKKRAELAEIQLKKTQETLQLERKLGQAELKAIRSQMNPHFLFNAFNSIQEYIILNERELASDYLGKFADLMRLFLDQSRKKTILLEDEIEVLTLYLELEKIRFEDALEVEISCDRETLDVSQIEIPPMLVQPFVENSLKHGLINKRGTKKITVSFSRKEDCLVATVKDNGVGRKQSAIINKQKMKKHKSFASSATQNRIDLLNIGKEKEISIQIIDLHDSEDKAIGTQVKINIPIQ